MRVTFRIHYNTQWGQQIYITGNIPQLGNEDISTAPVCTYLYAGIWELSLDLDPKISTFQYRYLLMDDQRNMLDEDWGAARSVNLPGKAVDKILFKDSWRNKLHPENSFYTSAFTDVIFKAPLFKVKKGRSAAKKANFRFQIHAPRLLPGQQLCVCGNTAELGNWNLKKPLLLGNANHPLWSADVAMETNAGVEYKYGFYDPSAKKVVALEAGANRSLSGYVLPQAKDWLCITDEYLEHPQGHWKAAGVALPVFSLRSQQGLGVGEFPDIKLLVDWAASIGLRMVQILPINDTSAKGTWVDSYPYSCLSTYALHPLYLNIDRLEGKKKVIPAQTLNKKRKQLNALPVVDYEAVMTTKLDFARKIFNQQKKTLYKNATFKKFVADNMHWLSAYALFCHRRDQNGTADFKLWKDDARFSQKALDIATDPKSKEYDEIAFYYFLQYHLDAQLCEAADYARSKGILLKGDIPIGIYRYSVDAWREPELFNMNGQSGAPPDPFSETGQNWGFPTYNWEEMAKDGYQWWQNRLKQLSRYFDAFRIDHILGFFRIWQIPLEQVEGTMGFFNPALPIRLEEFHQRHIAFHYERYCQPYITSSLLSEWFGEETEYVRHTFLDQHAPDHFTLKKDFDTQRKIDHFLSQENNIAKAVLKKRLFDLVGNVLFFEVPGSDGQAFHPRIDFANTPSYQALDKMSKERLTDLYNDYFYNRQEDFWKAQALTKLPVIKGATNMLICGEDLGMVPDCVPGVMQDLGFLTLEIQRMSKNPQTEFLQIKDIPYLSVASPSTHDMAPIRAWWEEMDAAALQRFSQQELGLPEAPDTCEPFIAERIIRQHLFWPGIWTVFPLQDLLAMDGTLRQEDPQAERINVPANPQHYWRYRLHLDLEDLAKASSFNEKMQALLAVSGR